MPKKLKPAGNPVMNREPMGHPALRKPKTPGAFDEVHRVKLRGNPKVPKPLDKANKFSYDF